MLLEIEDKLFDINLESNVAYSKHHSLCDCAGCKNYHMQSEKEMPELKNLLDKFGIDITKPDEIGWGDVVEGILDYIFVCYTVAGKVLKNDMHEVDIFDNVGLLSVVIDDKYIPNERKGEEYFTLTVYNIKLPYVLSEPLVTKTNDKKPKGFLSFFRKK